MMLTEIRGAAPDDSPGTRRWYRGDALEMVVWTDEDGVRQYQLRYRRGGRDGVYEWRRSGRLYHYRLDDGEGRAARVDATPILAADGPGALQWVRDRFAEESDGLPASLRTLVARTLVDPSAP